MRWSLLIVLLGSLSSYADDWPQWRGAFGNNHAAAGTSAPTSWTENSGLIWRTPLPGRGHSSPVLVGPRIYLTTCDEQTKTQALVVLDRATGELLRQTTAYQGKLPKEIHGNNTHASSTAACDGSRVFALFCNDAAAHVAAFDLDGNLLWRQRAIGFDPQTYKFGFGSSPIIVSGNVVVASEYDGQDSGVVALDATSGRQVWKAPRTNSLSYSTPILMTLAGRSQLVMSGNRSVVSYDPATGKELWSTEAPARATCGTMVWDADLGLAFASGGYPDRFTLAVRADGSGEVVWDNRIKCYEQSMLATGGHLYAIDDRGIAHCLRASDGEEMWSERLTGPVSSSPLLVGQTIYITNERGTTFVFAASADGYQPIAQNQLGDECFATPAPCDGRLYHRYADSRGGTRREFLVSIGN